MGLRQHGLPGTSRALGQQRGERRREATDDAVSCLATCGTRRLAASAARRTTWSAMKKGRWRGATGPEPTSKRNRRGDRPDFVTTDGVSGVWERA